MQSVDVDGLLFQFPAHWLVTKLDDWPFYRKHFGAMWDGIKAVDLGVIHGDTLFAAKACRCRSIQVVFHLEQPHRTQQRLTTFRPKRTKRAQQEMLQQLIQPIDRRARVVSHQRCYPLP